MALIIPGVNIDATFAFANGDIINGVAHFVTDTKPTTRIDASALVTGDRWYKSDDGTEWFWNGTYWLSQNRFRLSTPRQSASATATVALSGEATLPIKFFCETVNLSTSGANTATDYFTYQPGYGALAGLAVYFSNIFSTQSLGNTLYLTETINQLVDYSVLGTPNDLTMRVSVTKVGAPANQLYSFDYIYRLVSP